MQVGVLQMQHRCHSVQGMCPWKPGELLEGRDQPSSLYPRCRSLWPVWRRLFCERVCACVQLYVQRLGCQLQDVAAVRKVAGIAFALAMDALYDLPVLQFPPSLLAAALLFTARKTQVRCGALSCFPPWLVHPILNPEPCLQGLGYVGQGVMHASWQSRGRLQPADALGVSAHMRRQTGAKAFRGVQLNAVHAWDFACKARQAYRREQAMPASAEEVPCAGAA